ncbi:RNA 2',3'-cyclic phosphodiesterase [Candidatus Microgenomates bacterium]|nr:RNA 2',3'-cyclic phosphodiesterase [Candidatus Microgenomates bacterium]
MKTRFFVAINFPEETKEEISGLIDKLRVEHPQIRWEKTENIHLTLKFLSWTEEKKIKKILEGMKKSAFGIKPFGFKPEKLGYFLSQSLIVWIGVNAQEGLFQISRNLENEMKKLGFAKEKRVFSPHITIGRARKISPRKKWQSIAEEIKNFPTSSFSKFQVKEVILMKSQLTPKGSIYSVIDRILLE